MTPVVDQTGILNGRRACKAAGVGAMTIGGATLLGWWAGLPLLTNWVSGLPAMRPVGALCLAALGLAIVYPGSNLRLAFAMGSAVAVLAALGLALVRLVSTLAP
jgi:hypothetical protein